MNQKGFSLVETLVAVSVIVFGILTPITLVALSLKISSTTKNYLTAENLAQEGIELVRAKRGDNVLSGGPWLKDMQGPCGGPNGCGLAYDLAGDPYKIDIKPCGGGGANCILRFDFVYNYGSGPDTIFKRVISINELVVDVEAQVTVTVSWTDKSGDKSVTVEEDMFNWQ